MATMTINVGESKRRDGISQGKQAMLAAIVAVVYKLRTYWPLSDRTIHYEVLNDPPLRHMSKPDSRYVNNRNCYNDLCDMLTRARLLGHIPFESIEDPTRKIAEWASYDDITDHARRDMSRFLRNHCLDRQASQPHHLEIVGEKNTVESSIRSVAWEYGIPYTLGRGYCSLDPRHKMMKRFETSGKEKLAILVLSDFDPDGTIIATSFAESLRDDFGVDMDRIIPLKVCLHWDQVKERELAEEFDIPPDKMKLPKFRAHREKYGHHFHELEALSHEDRATMLREAILEVLDEDEFEATMEEEREQQAKIEAARPKLIKTMLKALKRHGLE
jgi:hypothetical protein